MAITILGSLVFFGLLFWLSRLQIEKITPIMKGNSMGAMALLLFGTALLLRVGIACTVQGFPADISTFKAWGAAVYDLGLSGVYGGDMFLDYPPGYLYVLGFLESVRRGLSLPMDTAAFTLIIKLPSLLADLVCAAGILLFARRKAGEGAALFLSGAFLLCPTVLLNSAAWGQVDSFCAMFLMGALLLLWKDKAMLAGGVYGLSVLCKPQMLVFAPIFLLWPIFAKKYKQIPLGVCSGVATLILLSLPFTQTGDWLWLPKEYLATLSSYAYFTVNAYNAWALAAMNWVALPEGVGTTLLTAGAVVLAVGCAAWILYRKHTGAIFAAGAALMSVFYLFSVKMHERYLFPVFVLLLLCCAVRWEARILRAFGALAAANALNVAHVLYLYSTVGSSYDPNSMTVRFFSALQVAALLYTLYALLATYGGLKGVPAFLPRIPAPKATTNHLPKALPLQDPSRCMCRLDVLLLLGIVAVYSVVAFWKPGERVMAQTPWAPAQEESVVLQADAPCDSLYYLPALVPQEAQARYRVGANVRVETSNDGAQWTQAGTLTESGVFAWQSYALPQAASFVRLTPLDGSVVLNEVGLRRATGDAMATITATGAKEAVALVDEPNTVPLYPSYENSSYFDEIYHARTAYEHILKLEIFENTHPPMGKFLIGLGIRVFGMNPFGWRFVGIVCGILMLPLLYHLIKQLLGSTLLSAVGTLLFAFDFMHFTQTRIATIDTYAVLFLLVMYDAMAVFLRGNLTTQGWKKLLPPLLVCGVGFGVGAASKWTVLYGAVGLAVLFFGKLLVTWHGVAQAGGDKQALLRRYCILCAWCVLFFIAIPFGLYFAAFLPLTTLPHNAHDVWGTFWNYQKSMLDYHSKLQEGHAFSSQWYSWPVAARPVWYYVKYAVNAEGQYGTIAAFGSPLLWWPCIPAMGFAAWQALRRKAVGAIVAVVAFLSVYLPWVLVPRAAFLYHYFTAVPFCIVALMLAWQALLGTRLLQKRLLVGKTSVSIGAVALAAYVAGTLVLFAVFFPVLSGMPMEFSAAEALRWLPNWYF